MKGQGETIANAEIGATVRRQARVEDSLVGARTGHVLDLAITGRLTQCPNLARKIHHFQMFVRFAVNTLKWNSQAFVPVVALD
jgi:hypothetical protein